MIFNWISRCWGGIGVTTIFQKARLNCAIPDWTAPLQQDIYILINTFQDKNPQIPAKTAMAMFFSHLQQGQQKGNPAFLLKQLYILDHNIEELTILDTIAYYYNSNLSCSRSFIKFQVTKSPLTQFISAYFAYIKTKARNFTYYQQTFFSKYVLSSMTSSSNIGLSLSTSTGIHSLKRKQITKQQTSILRNFQKQSFEQIINVIQRCQQIQKSILFMNQVYEKGQKKLDLINKIFTLSLKTYLRCYVIVSIGVKHLLQQFIKMNIKQMEKTITLIHQFNNQLTNNFIIFVESNKQDVEIFKSINYNELTNFTKQTILIFEEYYQELKSKQDKNNVSIGIGKQSSLLVRANSINAMALKDYQGQNSIIDLPLQIHSMLKQNMIFTFKPRKDMSYMIQKQNNIQTLTISTQTAFQQYKNGYHQDFKTQQDQLTPQKKDTQFQHKSLFVPKTKHEDENQLHNLMNKSSIPSKIHIEEVESQNSQNQIDKPHETKSLEVIALN